jgi:hypothetical protein
VGYARYQWRDARWQAETAVAIATWAEFAEQVAERATGPVTESALVVGEISALGRESLLSVREHIEIPAPAWHLRRAGFLAELAWNRLRKGQTDDIVTLKAIYAR